MQRTLYIIVILCWLPASVWAQSDESVAEEVDATEEAVDTTEEAVDTTEEAVDTTEEAVDTTEEVVDDTEEAVDTTEEAVESNGEEVETLGDEFPLELAVPYEPDDNRGDQLGNFVIGLHIGASVSVFSDLGAHVVPRLELGYNIPVWGRRLEPFVMLGYTPPRASGTVQDTRLPNSGEFSWEIIQQELSLAVGLLVRFMELGNFVNGYAAIAPQYVFLRSEINGSAGGEDFGENTETDGKWGVYGAVGVDIVLGPGAAFFQLGISWTDLNGTVTGDSNTGNLSPALGYRFML